MDLVSTNTKTIFSVDFDRTYTCNSICDYCYVGNTERLYKAYLPKIKFNTKAAISSPTEFAKKLNSWNLKQKKSKSKPSKAYNKTLLRMYGSGDYVPGHYKFLELLDFDYYIISKNLTLTTMVSQLDLLLALPHTKSIVLSFDNKNIANYQALQLYFKHPKITTSFTGTSKDFADILKTGKIFGIFFNISKKKKDKALAATFKENCPCTVGTLKSKGACTVCSKCWKPKNNIKIKLQKI